MNSWSVSLHQLKTSTYTHAFSFASHIFHHYWTILRLVFPRGPIILNSDRLWILNRAAVTIAGVIKLVHKSSHRKWEWSAWESARWKTEGSKSKTGLTKTLKLAETCIENSWKHGGGGHYVIPLHGSSTSLPPPGGQEKAACLHSARSITLISQQGYRIHWITYTKTIHWSQHPKNDI